MAGLEGRAAALEAGGHQGRPCLCRANAGLRLLWHRLSQGSRGGGRTGPRTSARHMGGVLRLVRPPHTARQACAGRCGAARPARLCHRVPALGLSALGAVGRRRRGAKGGKSWRGRRRKVGGVLRRAGMSARGGIHQAPHRGGIRARAAAAVALERSGRHVRARRDRERLRRRGSRGVPHGGPRLPGRADRHHAVSGGRREMSARSAGAQALLRHDGRRRAAIQGRARCRVGLRGDAGLAGGL